MIVEALARQLCEAEHPFLRQTGTPVPCGAHIGAARQFHILTTELGTSLFDVVARARAAEGLSAGPTPRTVEAAFDDATLIEDQPRDPYEPPAVLTRPHES